MGISELDPHLARIARARASQQNTDYDDLLQDARLITLSLLADGETDRSTIFKRVWQHLSLSEMVGRSAVVGVPVRVPADTVRKALRGALTSGTNASVSAALLATDELGDVAYIEHEDPTDAAVDALLAQLPSRQREALELSMAGWSVRAIAEEMGVTYKVARGLLDRARANARALHAEAAQDRA